MAASETRRPNYTWRIIGLGIFAVLLFGGYTAAWFYAGDFIKREADRFVASANQSGLEIECGDSRAAGFPFRIGLFCDQIRYAQPGQFALSAGALRTLAQVYNPFLIVAELDSPTQVDIDTGQLRGATIDLDWRNLRGSLRYTMDAPERISLETTELKAAIALASATSRPVLSASAAQAHMRPNSADMDLAGSFTGLQIDPSMLTGGSLPPFSGETDFTLTDGMKRINGGGDLLLGQSGTIRSLSLSTADASVGLSGTFSIGEDGLIDAKLVMKARNAQAIAPIAAAAFPNQAEQITQALLGLAALGDYAEIPVTIGKGNVTFGFIPLGRIRSLAR